MKVTLKTLTPLWTGGVNGTSDRLHATGIIGSLRWWYEAIVRGLGGYACDPTSVNHCEYNPKKTDPPEKQLCPACYLFGATGWRRRFRLIVNDRTTSGGPNKSRQPTGNRYKRNGKNRPSWYFKGGRTGEFELRFIPTASDFDPVLMQGVLTLIERWGGLAARPQLGYGLTELVSESATFNVSQFVDVITSVAKSRPGNSNALPSLDRMFFARIEAPDQGITATLNMKYDVRAAFRSEFGNNQTLRHWVCGFVRGNERQSSKINFSQAVDGEARVWGWIPDSMPIQGATRDEVMDEIKKTLKSYGTITCWREYDSPRDTRGKYSDMKAFLTSLLEDEHANV